MGATLNRIGWGDFFSNTIFAWTVATACFIRRGMDRWLWGLARVAHELDHAVSPDFQANESHHPWYHFCLRVGHFARIRWTHSPIDKARADRFRSSGND